MLQGKGLDTHRPTSLVLAVVWTLRPSMFHQQNASLPRDYLWSSKGQPHYLMSIHKHHCVPCMRGSVLIHNIRCTSHNIAGCLISSSALHSLPAVHTSFSGLAAQLSHHKGTCTHRQTAIPPGLAARPAYKKHTTLTTLSTWLQHSSTNSHLPSPTTHQFHEFTPILHQVVAHVQYLHGHPTHILSNTLSDQCQ